MIRTTIALVGLLALLPADSVEAQTWRTMQSARQLWDRAPTEVHIRYAAGELRVGSADSGMLYEMDLRYDEDHFRPLVDFDSDARSLRLGVEGTQHSMDLEEGSRAAIGLTREVPLDVRLEFGAGESEMELGGLRLRQLHVSTGASETLVRFDQPNPIEAERVRIEAGAAELEVIGLGNVRARRIEFQGGVGSTTLDFTGRWTANADASVHMGLGEVTLRFPRGLGVELRQRSFLTSLDSQGLVKRGDSYFSADWETAAHRLTIEINAAFGSVDVEWVG